MTVLMALSSIAVEQTKATERTMGRCLELLDYLTTNSKAVIRFVASNMVMNIHSDEPEAARAAIFSWDGC